MAADAIFRQKGAGGHIDYWFEPGGGHRPNHGYHVALQWLNRFIGTPGWTVAEIQDIPLVNGGDWCDDNGVVIEKLYGTELHDRGTSLPDLGIRNVPRERLACLTSEEVGNPSFTVEGWLQHIESNTSI